MRRILHGFDPLSNAFTYVSVLIRSKDRLVRLGGDEFLLYLDEMGVLESQKLISRLKENLDKVMEEMRWPVSFSMGVVSFFQNPLFGR